MFVELFYVYFDERPGLLSKQTEHESNEDLTPLYLRSQIVTSSSLSARDRGIALERRSDWLTRNLT